MKRMKRMLALLLALMLPFALTAAAEETAGGEWVSEEQEDLESFLYGEGDPFAPGDIVEDLTVTLCDGSETTLSALLEDHEVVLFYFWDSGVETYRQELAILDAVWQRRGDTAAVLALSVSDDAEAVAALREELGLSLPMGSDADLAVSSQFRIDVLPAGIMIDRYGIFCGLQEGSPADEDAWDGILDPYTGEDYEPDLTLGGAETPDVEMPEESEIAAALGVTDGALFGFSLPEEGVWPFVLSGEGGVMSSSAGHDLSVAALGFSVTAAEGDVLALEMRMQTEEAWDFAEIEMDGVRVKSWSGSRDWFTYALPLEAGGHSVTLRYRKDDYDYEDPGEDAVFLRSLTLLSGEEAAAALSENPVYPVTLEGADYRVEVLTESARDILFSGAEEVIDAYFTGDRKLCANADSLVLRIEIGPDIDPDRILAASLMDGTSVILSSCRTDETGFIVEWPLLSAAETGIPFEAIGILPDAIGEPDNIYEIDVFPDEPNVNYFVATLTDEDGVPVECSWTYADGTPPSTDEVVEIEEIDWSEMLSDDGDPEETSGELPVLAEDTVDYLCVFIDPDGNAVEGVEVSVADGTGSFEAVSDAGGVVEFTAAPGEYAATVISVPEGLAMPADPVLTLNEKNHVMAVILLRG